MRVLAVSITSLFLAGFCFPAQAPVNQSGPPPSNEVKGMPPRAAPTDYPSHAKAGALTVAAEFLGHSIPRPEGPLATEDYVAIEVAIFGPADARAQVALDNFSLRLNGKKGELPPQHYVLVVSSLKDPSWEPPEKPETKSKGGISTGGQDNSNEPPPPVHVPIELRRAMAQYVQRSSLPEGDRALPVAGLIFFQYRGKTNKLRSIELSYSGPAGKTTLDLQP